MEASVGLRSKGVVDRDPMSLAGMSPRNSNFRVADNSLGTVHKDLVSVTGSASRVFRISCSRVRPRSAGSFLFWIWLRAFDFLQTFFGTRVRGIEL
jgi:hypothetical protein